ncbi:putative transcription factor MYC/MYB [Helianthus annuus]|nr:putative transcription factor MYC/MYB [Helianthus annuus]
MEKTASFGSSSPLVVQQTSSLLQDRLKYLVESCLGWVYAIFWQTFKDTYNNLYLSFGDCYFRGLENFQQSQGMSSLNTVSELIIASASRSFVFGEDIVGGTFGTGSFVWLAGDNALQMNGSQRAKEVSLHGIRTLVCVGTSWGVVEFGSLEVWKEDWGIVQLTKSLFMSESDADIKESHLHQGQPSAQQGNTHIVECLCVYNWLE